MTEPKIITIDIETGPAHALVFGQYKQNIANVQIYQPDRVIGIGAKWHHEKNVQWRSEYHHGKQLMLEWIRDLLDEADIVVHFNGKSFDMPWIRREIILAGLAQPSPVQEIDLLLAVRGQFRFMNNKLENVVKMFKVGAKMKHSGFELWRDIEVGTDDEKRRAWAVMKRYCMTDVRIEEELYDEIRSWIPNHPNMALFSEENACRNCGAPGEEAFVYEGYHYTAEGKFRRYHCRVCGKWDRLRRRELGTINLQQESA